MRYAVTGILMTVVVAASATIADGQLGTSPFPNCPPSPPQYPAQPPPVELIGVGDRMSRIRRFEGIATEFRYGQRVRITRGFFQDQIGRVRDFRVEQGNPTRNLYDIELEEARDMKSDMEVLAVPFSAVEIAKETPPPFRPVQP